RMRWSSFVRLVHVGLVAVLLGTLFDWGQVRSASPAAAGSSAATAPGTGGPASPSLAGAPKPTPTPTPPRTPTPTPTPTPTAARPTRFLIGSRTFAGFTFPGDVTGLLVNVTIVGPGPSGGFVTLFPGDLPSPPNASTVNPATAIAHNFWATGVPTSGPSAGTV